MTAYRSRSPSLVIAVASVLFAIGAVVQALVRTEAGVSGFSRWAPAVVICALSAFCLARLARAGVYAGEDGIRVVNPLHTRSVPWRRVRRFTLRAHKGWPALGFVELIDGDPIEVWGIQARSRSPAAKEQAQAVVDALNERLDSVRG